MYFEREGAFTGEVSAAMIRDAGATHVIVGHSERRRLFGDTDEWVNRKTRAAIAAELTPIVCIGETLEERDEHRTLEVLDRQIRGGLDGLGADQIAVLLIAYEPVWAIGTGKNATPTEADEAHRHIRGRLNQWFGATAGDACRILYGGSVKPENIRSLIDLPDVDGALVGGASLEARTFGEIVRRASND
jgi:triosephosphate isomerase